MAPTAPLGRRAVALLLDVIVASWSVLLFLPVAAIFYAGDEGGQFVAQVLIVGQVAIAIITYIVLRSGSMALGRQTVGQKKFGLIVIDASGRGRPRWWQALLRAGLLLFAVAIGLWGFSPVLILTLPFFFFGSRRCLNDRACGTITTQLVDEPKKADESDDKVITWHSDELGRYPVLKESGIPVWEVIAAIRDSEDGPHKAALDLDISVDEVKAAVEYYAANPVGVDELAALRN